MGTSISSPTLARPWPLSRWDIAGAFGDIGVLFPITIALVSLNHMNPTAVFLAAGLTYILAGAYFRIPIPVQPFKAVAAIALAFQLPPSSIASAGLLMGVLFACIGLTNLITPLSRLFTLPIVRGIQLGLGLILAREGLRLAFGASGGVINVGGISISSSQVALGGAVVLLLFLRSRRYPSALVLLVAGILFGSLGHGRGAGSFAWGPVPLEFLHPRVEDLKSVLLILVLPQFALTLGNSVVATENTAQVLYGPQARRVTARALSLAIGMTNVASAMLTAAPTCHGSGGVTAHYKFGARTPKSNYVIGAFCLFLALFGRGAVGLLSLIPTAILGVFLVYVGVQHGTFVRDILRQRVSLGIAVSVGLVSLWMTNLTYGFLLGFLLHAIARGFTRVFKSRLRTGESTAPSS